MAGMRFPESRDSLCKSRSGNTGSRGVATTYTMAAVSATVKVAA